MKTSEHIEQCFTDIRDYIEELKETIGSLGHLNKTISSTAQKGIRELESRLAQVEKERDAAVHDMENYAGYGAICKHFDNDCPHIVEGCPLWPSDCESYEWRGICPENTKEEPK